MFTDFSTQTYPNQQMQKKAFIRFLSRNDELYETCN